MIEFDEALALLADNVRPLGSEQVELAAAHGRVLAEDVHALVSSPRRAVSAMDGFALRDADARVGASLRVIGRRFAGHPLPPALSAGECVRIFPGAELPDGVPPVIGFGASFPASRSTTTVEYEVDHLLWETEYAPAD